MRKLILIIFLLGSFSVGFSQTGGFSAKDKLKNFLAEKNKSELKKLQKGDKALNQAKAAYADADKNKDEIANLENQKASASKKDARKISKKINKLELKRAQKSISASKMFSQASKIYFYVYKNNFKFARIKVSSDEDKINTGKDLEKQANTLYKKAQTKRHQSLRIPKETDAYKILVDADKLEQQAIDKQLKAYGLYLGWYDSEDKQKPQTEEKTENDNSTKNEEISPFMAQKSDETNSDKKEDKTNEKVDENLPDFTEVKTTQTVSGANNTALPDEDLNKPQSEIFFKIQVAASQNPLSLSKLRSIYYYSLYNNEYENGYYKYSIGKFNSYTQAENFKKTMKTPGAFIVAYKDGRKVDVVEADPSLQSKRNNSTRNKVSPVEYGSFFRIQVSATRVPISDAQLKKIIPSDLSLKINHVNGWYKYTVGSFKTYSNAERFRKVHHIKGFTVHYINGKELK